MSRRARSRFKLGRVLSELAESPREPDPSEDHEGGIDILFRDGLDLAALDEPPQPQGAQPWHP